MARKSLSGAVPDPGLYQSKTVTVEAIDNGYLVTTSTCENGTYRSTKAFSEQPPSTEPAAERIESTSSLKSAIAAVRGR